MLEQWYREMPIVTRTYLTLALLTSAACHFDFISPLHLYFNPNAITQKYQVRRRRVEDMV
jgi:Derlin-2/3